MKAVLIFLVVAISAVPTSAEHPVDLLLVCDSRSEDGFQYFVRIKGEAGEIRMPRAQEPVLQTRDQNGWRPLKDIRITADEINARFNLSWLGQPAVRLDRVGGTLEVSSRIGGLHFTGDCRPVEGTERKF